MNWMSLIERHGLPTTVLLAVAFGCWRMAAFLKPIVQDIAASHLKTLRSVRRNLRVQTTLMEQSNQQLKTQGTQLQDIHRELLGVRPPVNGKV